MGDNLPGLDDDAVKVADIAMHVLEALERSEAPVAATTSASTSAPGGAGGAAPNEE